MVLWTQPWKKTSDRNPQQTLLTVMLLSLNKRTLMVTFIHVETLWVWEWSLKHKKADLKLKALKIVFRCVRVYIYVCVCGRGCRALSEALFRRLSWSKSCWTPYQTRTSCSHIHTNHSHHIAHTRILPYTIYPAIHITSIHRALHLKLRK